MNLAVEERRHASDGESVSPFFNRNDPSYLVSTDSEKKGEQISLTNPLEKRSGLLGYVMMKRVRLLLD